MSYPARKDESNTSLMKKVKTISSKLFRHYSELRACLQGGRVTIASGLTLAGGQKIVRVYKQNFHK